MSAPQEPTAPEAVTCTDLLALAAGWREEAKLLDSGNHPRRQGLPLKQVMQEACALYGCAADLERVVGGLAAETNDKLTHPRDLMEPMSDKPLPRVECSTLVAELETALSHAQKARDLAGAECARPSHDLLTCAENDLRAVLRAERRIGNGAGGGVGGVTKPTQLTYEEMLLKRHGDVERSGDRPP